MAGENVARLNLSQIEDQIKTLATQINDFRLKGGLDAFSSGDCTNGCTGGCTDGCTGGCTGGCVAAELAQRSFEGQVGGGG